MNWMIPSAAADSTISDPPRAVPRTVRFVERADSNGTVENGRRRAAAAKERGRRRHRTTARSAMISVGRDSQTPEATI